MHIRGNEIITSFHKPRIHRIALHRCIPRLTDAELSPAKLVSMTQRGSRLRYSRLEVVCCVLLVHSKAVVDGRFVGLITVHIFG
jgi:hypothetical protein